MDSPDEEDLSWKTGRSEVPVDQVVNILVTITLIQLMVTVGLGVTFTDVAHVARNWGLVARAAVANYVLVPAIATGLLVLFHAPPLVAAGFLVAAVCPGAPYGPPFTGMAKGNVPISVGLTVMLAGSSAIVAPILLHVLLPVTSGEEPLRVDAGRMVGTLFLTQLIPLGLGLVIRQCRPDVAEKLRKPANRLSVVLNLAAFSLIVVVDFHLLASIRVLGFEGILLLVIAALADGWLLGGPGDDRRTAMTFSTGARNVSVSLVIVTASFPRTPAVTAVLAYALFQTIVLALLAMGWGRWTVSRRQTTR
jgi:BASS family bile acid:Na+ symporter